MQNPQQSQPGWTPIEDTKRAAGWVILAAQVLSAPLLVFLRTGFGQKFFGIPSALAFLLLPMWIAFWPGEDGRPLLWFWAFYLIMQLRARLEIARMVAAGRVGHSRYNGWPRFASVFRRMSEDRIKGVVEPAVAFACGAILVGINPPLGSYLICAGVSLVIVQAAIEAVEKARAVELYDAHIEQQLIAARFREMQRGPRA